MPDPKNSTVLFCMVEGSLLAAFIFLLSGDVMLLLRLWVGQNECLTNSTTSSHLLGSYRVIYKTVLPVSRSFTV